MTKISQLDHIAIPFELEPEPMRRHRTTARGALLFFVTLGVLAGTAAAPPAATTKPIIFPVLGAAHYVDDFGAPPGGGEHPPSGSGKPSATAATRAR